MQISTLDWLNTRASYLPPSLPVSPEPVQLRGGSRGDARSAPLDQIVRRSSDWQDMLRQMVIYPAHDCANIESFIHQAASMGPDVCRFLLDNRVKVALVPEGVKPSDVGLCKPHERGQSGALLDTGAGGFYRARQRMCVIRECNLRSLNKSTVVHELAHALDDILTKKCRFGEPLSKILWHGFARTRQGLASDYMLHGPHEYFAVSLELYYDYWGRQHLRRLDPELVRFLEGCLP